MYVREEPKGKQMKVNSPFRHFADINVGPIAKLLTLHKTRN
jgi:hypothetical protein